MQIACDYHIISFIKMNQEFFLRDDIIDLSSRLDSENYNIKAYRKRNKSQTNKNHKHFLLSTEVITSDIHDDLKDKSAEPTQRTTQIMSARRLSVTAGVRKRSHLHEAQFPGFTKTARTKNNSALDEPITFQDRKDRTIINIKSPEIKEAVIGNFSKLEKEYSKGGQLKNKHLENWLNQILLQYCHEEKFDSTIENPALKKYGIDKNSLLSKGINPQNLERIYKSLFVYSMGFNTLLKEIGSKNMNIRKTFWKVYAILLEYCSDGDFDTMIGEIERDKVRKMEIMKEEIQRRQEIIENNEEINQQKNAKIFKELKQLRQENSNLENDKNVLMEDYKEAEQAFNEEVSLRLKFQNKINEIHGVHRELGIKHQKLYDDLQSKNYQSVSIKEKLARITEQYISLKTDNEFIKKENSSLKAENQFNYSLVEDMKKKSTLHQLQQIQWKHKKEQFVIMIREKQKKIEQIKGELKNSQLMLQMKEKAQVQLQKQYKRSLQQNKQLVSSLQKELQQINVYMLEKKEFNDTHSRIYAELQIANRYLTARDEAIKQLKKEISNISQQNENKNIQIETLQNKNRQFDLDIKDLYTKIGQMKKIKTMIEQELTQSRSRQQYYKNYYFEKEKIIASLTEKLEEDERLIAQFNLTKKTLQSKVNLLSQKLSAEEQTNRKKIDKLKGEINALDRINKTLKAQIEQKANEIQRATALYQDTFNKLKDQMFERNDLQLRYNQSLSVVESETDHIKKLNIKISEMQEKYEDIVRKLKGVQFILENKEKTYQKELHQHMSAIHTLKEQIKIRKMYIHPMKYEDNLSQMNRKQDSFNLFKEQVQLQKKKLNIPALQGKIRNLQSELFQCQINYAKQIQIKDKEINVAKTKIDQLQQILQKRMNKQIQNDSANNPKASFKEKQRKYLEIIKQKTIKVEDLLKQVQRMHDQNNQLLVRVSEIQKEMKQKTEKIQMFQKEISHFESQKHALNLQKTHIFKEKEKLLAQISDQQSRMIDSQEKGYVGMTSNREIKSQQKSSRLDNISRQSTSRQKIQPGWRNDFSKKVKNAVNYYKK